MSANITVTVLRVSRGPSASVSGVAHSEQNFALSGFSSPQEEQTRMSASLRSGASRRYRRPERCHLTGRVLCETHADAGLFS